MIEDYGRIIVVNGEVLPVESYYDGVDETEDGPVIDTADEDTADEARIDKIISGIERHDTPNHHDARALAQGALFLLDKDCHPETIRSSVMQHPSSHNISTDKVDTIASNIIQAFNDETERLGRYKKNVDLSAAKRDAFIAAIRNLEQLNKNDLERIAVTLGYDKNHFEPKARPDAETNFRERDWRERQFKD